ncbi:T20M3.17 PROTEIN [Salix koriyanagi]|uniref:T20M3.17 PROTEIN n=1 Tax=Salix koriyanagi TaxID=2511006 RepID=A0A9Q0UPB5_9ROSI|nr:T20M3.17 PROTEIN [Salix koriyanagi]
MKKTRFDQSEPESPRQISGPDGTERKSTVSKIGKMGPVCKARNKTAEVVIELVEQEEIDLDEQIGKEICSNDHCMWLTSDSSSPTGFFDEYRLSSSLHVSVDEWMISWSSTLAKSDVHLDKASSISDKSRALNPDQEDESSERTGPELEVFLQEDLKEETRFRLISEPCRRKTDFYVHLDKASSISDKSRTPNPEEDESSERTGPELEMFLQEDLEEENRLCLISEPCRRKTDFSVSSSDSPSSNFEHCCGNLTGFDDSAAFDSPSCSLVFHPAGEVRVLRAFSSSSNVSTPGKFKKGDLRRDSSPENSSSEAEVLKDSNTDGPLFWPFDKKLEWDSEEDWKCFAMSPRKDMPQLSISPRRVSSESAEMKFHGSRVDSKVVCRRRLVFSSGPAAPNIPEKKQRRDDHRSAKKMNSMRSGLKKSVKDGKVSTPKVNSDDFASNKKLAIEMLLGLDEFDGHEGVDSEFNEAVFSLKMMD